MRLAGPRSGLGDAGQPFGVGDQQQADDLRASELLDVDHEVEPHGIVRVAVEWC